MGGCSEKISREHLISRSLFPNPTVLVEGYDWCKESRSIGIDSLTRKILCARHNSALSIADETITKLNAIANHPRIGITISGRALECWFLKTLVNLSIGTDTHIGCGMAESLPGWPPPYLAAVAFSSLRLTHSMGLYILNCEEPYKYKQGEIIFTPLVKDNSIGGALFGIAGLYFFLSINPGATPTTIGDMTPSLIFPPHVRAATMSHRPIWLDFADKQGNVARMNIDWTMA